MATLGHDLVIREHATPKAAQLELCSSRDRSSARCDPMMRLWEDDPWGWTPDPSPPSQMVSAPASAPTAAPARSRGFQNKSLFLEAAFGPFPAPQFDSASATPSGVLAISWPHWTPKKKEKNVNE